MQNHTPEGLLDSSWLAAGVCAFCSKTVLTEGDDTLRIPAPLIGPFLRNTAIAVLEWRVPGSRQRGDDGCFGGPGGRGALCFTWLTR